MKLNIVISFFLSSLKLILFILLDALSRPTFHLLASAIFQLRGNSDSGTLCTRPWTLGCGSKVANLKPSPPPPPPWSLLTATATRIE